MEPLDSRTWLIECHWGWSLRVYRQAHIYSFLFLICRSNVMGQPHVPAAMNLKLRRIVPLVVL